MFYLLFLSILLVVHVGVGCTSVYIVYNVLYAKVGVLFNYGTCFHIPALMSIPLVLCTGTTVQSVFKVYCQSNLLHTCLPLAINKIKVCGARCCLYIGTQDPNYFLKLFSNLCNGYYSLGISCWKYWWQLSYSWAAVCIFYLRCTVLYHDFYNLCQWLNL